MITLPRMYPKLRINVSVPPNPLTIFEGLVSRKFGYNAPKPVARAFSVRVITPASTRLRTS